MGEKVSYTSPNVTSISRQGKGTPSSARGSFLRTNLPFFSIETLQKLDGQQRQVQKALEDEQEIISQLLAYIESIRDTHLGKYPLDIVPPQYFHAILFRV